MNQDSLLKSINQDRLNKDQESIEFKRFILELKIFEDNPNLYDKHEKLLLKNFCGNSNKTNSYMAYLLGITNQICDFSQPPCFRSDWYLVRYSPPDIDTDFMDRDKICEYLSIKYGENRVAPILTFNEFQTKAAIKSAIKFHNVRFEEKTVEESANELSKLVDNKLNKKFEEAILEPEINNFVVQYPQVFETARGLVGVKSHIGMHASAMILCDDDINTVTPLMRSNKGYVSQFDMHNVEDLGVLKMDILCVKDLIVVSSCLNLIKSNPAHNNFEPDIFNLNTNDQTIYSMLAEGHTSGVFQFESYGITKMLKNMKVSSFDDLVAANALYRPGPLGSQCDLMYCERKVNPHLAKPPHPALEGTLRSTLGVWMFQEQVMKASRVLAGFSYTESDELRKVIGKKQTDKLPKMKEKFLNGCLKNGYNDLSTMSLIWEQMEKFGEYGFNKSHSAAYSYLSFITAFLKRHFSREFFASLMTKCLKEDSDSDEVLPRYEKEAQSVFGIKFLPININMSKDRYTLEPDGIRRPIRCIKGIGDIAQNQIISNQPYDGIQDYIARCDAGDSVVQLLVTAGAFDCFGVKEQVLEDLRVAKSMKNSLKNSKKTVTSIPNLKAIFSDPKRK